MATLTAARPAARSTAAPCGSAVRTVGRPGPGLGVRSVRPQVRTAPRGPRYALTEPVGLSAMRARVAGARAALVTRDQVLAVLQLARTGLDLDTVCLRTGLGADQVLDVVAGVGSRISQANKTGPKVTSITCAADTGRPAGAAVVGKAAVVLPLGFEPAAPHGRDVRKALAAIRIADPAGDDRPVGKWLDAQSKHLPVEFTHLVHWHFLAQRGTHDLSGDLFAVDVQAAFVRAWDLLAGECAAAVAALARLLNAPLSGGELAAVATRARWLAPEVDQLAAAAEAAARGDAAGARAVPGLLAHVRRIAEARPGRYLPRALGDLSREQLRMIAAVHGMSAADIDDSTRTTRNLDEYAKTVAAVRAKVEAELAALGQAS